MDFIALTDTDGDLIYVNPAQVVLVKVKHDGSFIQFLNGGVYVKEDHILVLEKIENGDHT